MTVPTISQLKGNTLLELFKNGYNSIKDSVYSKDETDEIVDAVANEIPDMTLYYDKTETYSKAEVNTRLAEKQNNLIAGDNIIIDEETNTISAIQGGSLDNYYTKSETDTLLNAKADASDVYDKTETYSKSEVYAKTETYSQAEIGSLLANNGYKIINTITPTITTGAGAKYIEISGLQEGDIVDIHYVSEQRTVASDDYTYDSIGAMFIVKPGMDVIVGRSSGYYPISSAPSGSLYFCDAYIEARHSTSTGVLTLITSGHRVTLNNGEFTSVATYCRNVTAVANMTYTILRRA